MKAPTMNANILGLQNSLRQNADIRGGREAILLNKALYFTKLELQTADQFDAMVSMAPTYILYPKIVDGFVGTIFAKEPNLIGVDTESPEIIEDVDLLGNSINKLSEKIVACVLENGFCATYNDYSDDASRAFIRFVDPASFIRIRTASVEGRPVISQFIYREDVEVDDPEDEFNSKMVETFTVLDLEDGIYRVRVLQKDEHGELIEKSTATPRMNGETFAKIPITIHGPDANNLTPKKSPLQDLSDMNISIMQRVVDQVYMLHWTALPTPYVTGVDPNDKVVMHIGPSKALKIPNSEAKVGMLEFSGSSATAHQDYIDNLKDIMAATGAQILKKEGVSRETATSVLVRTAAQTSLVATIVKNTSSQVASRLKVHLAWQAVSMDADYNYKLNDDFVKVDMEPNAQIALVKSWIDGAISHRTLFKKMKEGELIEPNKTFESEVKDIKENPPPFFIKNLESELALKAAEAGSGGDDKDDLKGSNLENGEVPNKQATEMV